MPGSLLITVWDSEHRTGDKKTLEPPHRGELVNVISNEDWNIGLRWCPEKMSSLGRPTVKKKSERHSSALRLVVLYSTIFFDIIWTCKSCCH